MTHDQFVRVLVGVVLAATTLCAQSQEPKPLAFEVASVKPNDSGSNGVAVLPAANGGWRARISRSDF